MDSASAAGTASTTTGGGTRKKIDDRVKVLLEDCARKKHRSIFLLLGDRSKDQITAIHAMVSRANHTARVNVVWCMKNDPLFISTSKTKLRRQGSREVKAGMASEESKDTFEAFLTHNDIRYTHYKDTHRILGQTFGMAILQDFEAMTPNILARTIETVSGGGAILILLRSMSSLRQLYTMTMDVHSRYRSDTHGAVIPRFNERFLLSLCDCENMISLDDDLAVLPITNNIRHMLHRKQQAAASQEERLRLEGRTKHEADLADLKGRLKDHEVVGPLVGAASTVDQAKTILGLMQAVAEKTLNATCAVTAGRGRGKSAALGLTLAGAIREGYSNILVTAPSPENLQTLFEFAVKGLKELGYVERTDFNVMLSTNPEFAKCTVAIQVFRDHRQTIQFIAATDSEHFHHAEILVVDEAAAIPLTLVQQMLGPYLVFLASTISGYEGTGRSLSLKLIADMKKRSNTSTTAATAANDSAFTSSATSTSAAASSSTTAATSSSQQGAVARVLRELSMQDPIRYGPDDPVEQWLNKLLCFDSCSETPIKPSSVPHPVKCDLYYIDRDALFSYHPTAELLLHKIMALLVAAHYKNQPNDLQLLSDAPGHHLFVLCAPPNSSASANANTSTSTSSSTTTQQQQQQAAAALLPDILCVIHASEEGNVTANNLAANLDKGMRPSGDLIPYTIAQQYLEKSFPKLAGMRVVRIATNPEIQRSGYGSRALDLFTKYYEGSLYDSFLFSDKNNDNKKPSSSSAFSSSNVSGGGIEEEGVVATTADSAATAESTSSNKIVPRKKIPTLLKLASNRAPLETAEYVGVSFGLNTDLYNFWNRNKFHSIYLRQVPNDLTGEHSCIMVRPLVENIHVFGLLRKEFRRRFIPLLPLSYRHLSVELAVCLSSGANGRENFQETVASRKNRNIANTTTDVGGVKQLTWSDLTGQHCITISDHQRLRMYTSSVSDVALMLDLAPSLASLYFRDMLHYRPSSGTDGVALTPAQRAILLATSLQGRHFDELTQDRNSSFANVPVTQLKGIFLKAITKFVEHFDGLRSEEQTNQEEGEMVDEEEVRRDGKGNIIGLQVVRKMKKKIETDQTLLRDANAATLGSSSNDNQQQGGRGGSSSSSSKSHHQAKRRSRN